MAHFRLVQRRMLAVDTDERGHERVGFFHVKKLWLFQCGLYVQRLGRQGDLAFVSA
ncbi:hypothetical protein D3C84_1302210 [compost metagenome]